MIAERDGITYEEAQVKIRASLPDTEDWPEAKLHDFYGQKGLSLIRRYPLLYIKVAIRHIVVIMTAQSSGYFMRYGDTGPIGDLIKLPVDKYIRKWLVDKPIQLIVYLFDIVHLLILNTAAIYSLWRVVGRQRKEVVIHLLIWGVISYMLVASAQSDIGARFRVPIAPLLVIYAGAGLDHLFRPFKPFKRGLYYVAWQILRPRIVKMKDIKLSIIILVYNELNTVLEIIRRVQNEEREKKIIVR